MVYQNTFDNHPMRIEDEPVTKKNEKATRLYAIWKLATRAAGIACGRLLSALRKRAAIQGTFFFFSSCSPFLSLSLFSSPRASLPLFALLSAVKLLYIFVLIETPAGLPPFRILVSRNCSVITEIFLKFALSLTHDLSQECRQVSPFGTRRSTISLGDNAQPLIE
jgi:hypothetical protein